MKKIVLGLLIILTATTIDAQISIGSKKLSSPSVLLEFKEGTTSGIVLPKITNGILFSPGQIVFSCDDRRVEYYYGDEGKYTVGIYPMSLAPKKLPAECNKTLVPSPKSLEHGVLITDISSDKMSSLYKSNSLLGGSLKLVSHTKTLVLPKVNDAYLRIKSPAVGTIVYDPKNKVVSVYNGFVWTFLTNSPPSS